MLILPQQSKGSVKGMTADALSALFESIELNRNSGSSNSEISTDSIPSLPSLEQQPFPRLPVSNLLEKGDSRSLGRSHGRMYKT